MHRTGIHIVSVEIKAFKIVPSTVYMSTFSYANEKNANSCPSSEKSACVTYTTKEPVSQE